MNLNPSLRPPTRADKGAITSIAELKKAIEYAFVREEFARENVMFALKQFEASVKERLKELEKGYQTALCDPSGIVGWYSSALYEVRKVLGEGSTETTVKECVKHETEWTEDDYGTHWLICKKCGETLKEERLGEAKV